MTSRNGEIENFPAISIIVTAYNRKQFLMDALKSCLNQTVERDKYEIVVVKNFVDDAIDSEIEGIHLRNIFSTDRRPGAKLFRGLRETTGEIVCFLEDDDLFEPKKLEDVLTAFKNNDVVFFKDQVTKVSKDNVPLEEDLTTDSGIEFINSLEIDVLRKRQIGCYLSSMCIRRSLIEKCMENIERLETVPDIFMFYLFQGSGKLMALDRSRRTRYRVLPNSGSHHKSTDVVSYVKKKTEFIGRVINDINEASVVIPKGKTRSLVESHLNEAKFERAILAMDFDDASMENYGETLRFLIKSRSLKYMAFFLFYPLYRLFPRLGRTFHFVIFGKT